MSRFRKLSHSIWYCQYHIIGVPKYRYRILHGEIARDVGNSIRAFSQQQKCEIVELNIQIDHVYLLVMIPAKVAVSDFVSTVKGRAAIRVLNKFKELKQQRYWGNHFWARGYCADTVGLDFEMVRKYVQHQEKKERKYEKSNFDYH